MSIFSQFKINWKKSVWLWFIDRKWHVTFNIPKCKEWKKNKMFKRLTTILDAKVNSIIKKWKQIEQTPLERWNIVWCFIINKKWVDKTVYNKIFYECDKDIIWFIR